MSFVALVVSIASLGLVVGALARFALPGSNSVSLAWTSAVGVAGTVVGGLIGNALFGSPGLPLLGVLVSMAILVAWRRVQRRLTQRRLTQRPRS